MGCQCAKKADEEELENISLDQIYEEPEKVIAQKRNEEIPLATEAVKKKNQKEQIINENNPEVAKNQEPKEEKEEDYLEKLERLNEEKNIKYAEYPDNMVEIINKIRENPAAYADTIEDSIKYIEEEPDKNNPTKKKLIFKKKVKVSLTRGEPAFHEAAERLRNLDPLPPLEFNGNICIPLPQNEEELKAPNYLKDQAKTLKETENIDIYFKDSIKLPEVSALLMVVDDNANNSKRKSNAILNKNFKYIGINSHFIGKTFLAYFSFSK